MASYLLLLTTAFVAATLFPLSSEALLILLLNQEKSAIVLWLIATTGNSLGGTLNWFLGRYCLHFKNHSWFPFKESSLGVAQNWFNRFGLWTLLLTWLPIVGDGLTFLAGVMKVRFSLFLVLMAIGKGSRYAVVILIALGLYEG